MRKEGGLIWGGDTISRKDSTIEINDYDMFRNNSTCRLGRRPVRQNPLTQPGNHGWTEKYATGIPNAKIKVTKQTLKIGTWNVRSLTGESKLQLLRN